MCGLAGVVDASGRGPTPAARAAIQDALSRRGPDARQVWHEGPCTLLHCRLRVIDTSARADQPFAWGGPNRVIMVFNGEVYNYRTLRDELRRDGVTFDTTSDAEVLLAGYVRWGESVFRRARGMWAAAFWRPDAHELQLVRDPLGKKPLLYWHRGERMVFASNLRALLAGLDGTPEIDPSALDCYLGNLVVPQEHCIFQGVAKVPPGTVMTWRPGGDPLGVRYWSVPAAPSSVRDEDSGTVIEGLLRSAVRRRLESDVPLGLFLSGGLDSGLVAAIAAQESRNRLVAITAGTAGSPDDERQLAAEVARRYGLLHDTIELAPVSAAPLPLLLNEIGEPFADASLLPTFHVARACRQSITVALTGDGGDEAFFGYSTFQGVYWAQRYRALVPAGIRNALKDWARRRARRGTPRKLAALFDYGATDLWRSFRNRMAFSVEERGALLVSSGVSSAHVAEHVFAARLAALAHLPDADALRRVFFETYLPNDYLAKVDTATMTASLEARCPFLDVDLVEYVLGLPSASAFPGGRAKALLRPLVERLLPSAVARRRKTGFSIPVGEWLRNQLRPAFEEFVFRPGRWLGSAVQLDRVRDMQRAQARGSDCATQLWAILALSVWAAMFVDRDWSPSDDLPLLLHG